jgi:general secretion pathway protein E/type IV pilus assembly protein PilB
VSIGQTLVGKGLLSPEQLQKAVELQQREGLRLDRAVIQLGFLSELQVLELLAEQLHLTIVDLEGITIDNATIKSLPPRFVYRKRLVPISRENGTLRVAMSDAFDNYVLDEIRLVTGLQIEQVLAPREEIEKLIKTHYGVGGDTVEEMVGTDEIQIVGGNGESTEDLLEMAQEASVIKLVNEIILEAINERASDIHIEPYEHDLDIRYRIDGVLQVASVPPQIHRFQSAIISRIKILSNMNIAEKRLPQDGRIKFQVGGRQVDVRVSVIPMIFGEGVVMRILDKTNVLYKLTEIGMDEDTYVPFKELLDRPHGIILVTGPTGSGKTTTLYAGLNEIVGTDLKVITVEDPVEYNLQGVNQIPVDHNVGMTFARGLRAILRHDPDVVMIGEIRDLETAQAATQAALTGHLVLSTLHTNDAASAAMRMIDMGIEPYLVTSTLIGAMAQRLVRKICPDCKESYEPEISKLPKDLPIKAGEKLYRGVGCQKCRNSGFRGRLGIYELMTMNDDVRAGIMSRAPISEIVEAARPSGLRLLREDGWVKVKRGVTTPSEVLRCTAH